MIDFKEELSKYKPVLSLEEVEDAINNEITDIMDLLQYISGLVGKSEAHANEM